MIICETFALIVADKNRYTELLVFLRQKLHKGELKSKSLFKIEEELIQHRWSSDKHIGEKMFTSVPSCGVSIFDPSEAIWFDWLLQFIQKPLEKFHLLNGSIWYIIHENLLNGRLSLFWTILQNEDTIYYEFLLKICLIYRDNSFKKSKPLLMNSNLE